MPDIVVHNAMGDRVVARLPEEIRKELSSSAGRDAFHVGVLGPDPFFFYWFLAPRLRHGVDERGGIMHHKKCRAFLLELGRQCCAADRGSSNGSIAENCAADREGFDDGEIVDGDARHDTAAVSTQHVTAGGNTRHNTAAFAYFCGFLCHYALDSTVHPYINMLAARRVGMHTAVERKLDRMELRQSGRTVSDIMKLVVPFPDIPEIRGAMKAVYGWDDNCFRTGYRHMKWFLSIVKDKHLILDKITGSTPMQTALIPDEEMQRIKERRVDSDYAQKIRKLPPIPIPKKGIPRLFARLTGKNYRRISAFPYSNHYCDDTEMDDFARLEIIAEEYAVNLITTAYDYRAGTATEQNLADLIGDRNYSGGADEE